MTTFRFYLRLIRLLGFVPLKLSLYRQAFLPKSASTGNGNRHRFHNERLEFLGDAVLDAIVADYLFVRFPGCDEGFMTKMRSRIVKRKNLDVVAEKMDIPSLITPGSSPGNISKHLFGNTLEALMGAIYLDRGFHIARRFFVRQIVRRHIDPVKLVRKDPDYKSRVIEWAQKQHIRISFESMEEHPRNRISPSFVSRILMNGVLAGTGRGGSKKDAEQQAAREALSAVTQD